ncbi:MAG TPA: apolipoprotein N-acyltransferase [Candidatus Binatia bacterium]|nr:apolipoprotein N-acyltransferase [Candidatus Binatia bacterium]
MDAAPILVVASALVYSAAFPPLDVAALAWVGLVPFFVAAAKARSVRRAALLGLLWGVALTAGVGWPLPGMIVRYFGEPAWVAALVSLAVAIGLSGVFYAAFAGWLAVVARAGAAGPLLVAAGFAACELLRGSLVGANPWGLAAYSQTSSAAALPIVQIADLAGPYAIGFLVAAVNASLAACATRALRGRHPRAAIACVAALLVGATAYGLARLATPFDGDPIAVAIVQPGTARGFEWRPEYAKELPEGLLAQSEAAAVRDAALVVWPESAVSFYVQEDRPERRALLAAVGERARDLVFGGPAYAYGERAVEYYNSIFLVRDGRLAGRYDKLRLVPLAERDDLHGLLPRAYAYTPGRDAAPLRSRAGKLGAFLCFEAMYPETVRRFVAGGADLLVNLSNDAWFGGAAPAEMHLAMARLRAVETRRWLVRGATTGVSAIVDPHGRVTARSAWGEPAIVTGDVRRAASSTFYAQHGDVLAWLDLIVVFAVALRYSIGSARRRSRPQNAAAGPAEPSGEDNP